MSQVETLDGVVHYAVQDGIALVTMHRPEYHNAQNSQMTYALDAAFRRAVDDDAVKVIVLRGAGKHFSAGHDIGTPGRDINKEFERAHLLWDHSNKPGGEFLYMREQEVYLGMCRRWREMPKPTIAMVQGACIAGGLMLAWVCDLIVASEDAFFQDPVQRTAAAETQLIRRARHFGNLSLGRSWGQWRIAAEYFASGPRFDNHVTAFPATRVELRRYDLFNLVSEYRIAEGTVAYARLENAFDRDYVLTHGYNTQGRKLALGLRHQF